jgi:transcriptional regulator with XRE-family HTH domain
LKSIILTCIINVKREVGVSMIGKRLRALREKKGLKQIDIANVLGVSRTTYTQYETEKSEPDLATVAKLAEYFNCSTDYLLGKSDDPRPPDPDIKDAPLAFYGNTEGLNLDILKQIISEAVNEALEEREKKKKNEL